MGLILCINENADRLSPLLTHRMRCHTRVSAPQHTASEVAGVRDWQLASLNVGRHMLMARGS
jgi:hypothetical protein